MLWNKKKMEYKFKTSSKKPQFSKPDILNSLKRFAEITKYQSFGMRDYDAWSDRLVTSDTVVRYFGSWGTALKEIGVRAERGLKIDIKKMVDVFKECWKELDNIPSRKQLELYLSQHNYPFRWKSYINIFGSIGKLAQLIVEVQEGTKEEKELYKRQISRKTIREPISARLRYQVLKRDGEKCKKCGISPKHTATVVLHVDHIIPVTKGGKTDIDNLQTLCEKCNLGKSSLDN